MSSAERVSVCIVTYERHTYLLRCLESLVPRLDAGDQIVVVDASRMSAREPVTALAPKAVYVHAPHLAGWMTRSRNEALLHAEGSLVAFLDDDVVLEDGWRNGVVDAFLEPGVCAVAGRTRNGEEGEERARKPIGRLLRNGSLTAEFAADPGKLVDIDHGIGANMSFRRSILARLGGFRDDYPGTAMREDTDVFLRVRLLGCRVVFAPAASVEHRAAPHVHGRRFDLRYELYGRRNHMVMLARYSGIRSLILCRWVAAELGASLALPSVHSKVRRLALVALGVGWGGVAMMYQARWTPMPPERKDAKGNRLRSILDLSATGE